MEKTVPKLWNFQNQKVQKIYFQNHFINFSFRLSIGRTPTKSYQILFLTSFRPNIFKNLRLKHTYFYAHILDQIISQCIYIFFPRFWISGFLTFFPDFESLDFFFKFYVLTWSQFGRNIFNNLRLKHTYFYAHTFDQIHTLFLSQTWRINSIGFQEFSLCSLTD